MIVERIDVNLAARTPIVFRDRREAGRLLASLLRHLEGRNDVVVLALPRGGVPVGYEVALAIGAPFDVFAVRKLGVPGHEELAMGAIGSGGAYVLNDDVIGALGIPQDEILRVARRERAELERRQGVYRDSRPYPDVAGKVVVLVDDGLATGASMLAAVSALRRKDPARTIVAIPVAPRETCAMLAEHADEVICYEMPEPLGGVGTWYEDFSQTTDEEVRALLNEAALRPMP
ncbi:MAG TPA: phosphoribosyltransferase [Candidatus Limnocylindria bacterium]|jgi:putative phosphoribosyl transferase|nr:phosphoribosyltransferase [Candidatus Limnocylindria bacterium]